MKCRMINSHKNHIKSSSSTTSRNSRLVVDEDDNGKPRLERVKNHLVNGEMAIKTTGPFEL